MEEVVRISSPISEHWMAWLMLLALVLPFIARQLQVGILSHPFQTLFSVKERDSIFTNTSADLRARLIMLLFKVIILSLMVMMLFSKTDFTFLLLAKIAGVIVAAGLVKTLLSWVVSVVFFNNETFSLCFNQYAELLTAFCIIVYPALLLYMYWSSLPYVVFLIYAIVAAIFFYICVIIKLFRLFFNKLLASFYILLYLCILEWLPLLAIGVITYSFVNL